MWNGIFFSVPSSGWVCMTLKFYRSEVVFSLFLWQQTRTPDGSLQWDNVGQLWSREKNNFFSAVFSEEWGSKREKVEELGRCCLFGDWPKTSVCSDDIIFLLSLIPCCCECCCSAHTQSGSFLYTTTFTVQGTIWLLCQIRSQIWFTNTKNVCLWGIKWATLLLWGHHNLKPRCCSILQPVINATICIRSNPFWTKWHIQVWGKKSLCF